MIRRSRSTASTAVCGVVAMSLLLLAGRLADAQTQPNQFTVAVRTLTEVGPKGKGHAEAIQAWQVVTASDAKVLPELLLAIKLDEPLAANWLRAAVDTIAERTLRDNRAAFPQKELEALLATDKLAPRARRQAFEWIERFDRSARERLIPTMLNDSSVELRRDAVATVLASAEQLTIEEKTDAAKQAYITALTAARDLDQIEAASGKLTEMGEQVDLARHFGFLTRWKVIGPFDNTDKKGFAVVYPPETKIELQAECDGKVGKVRWLDHTTSDKFGMVNLNEALGKNMGAAGYAYTVYQSAEAQEVDLRLGCINASKLWVNGKLLTSNDVYHSGTEIDQYVVRVALHEGPNTILVKVCQNEQTDSWAQDWQFQLRVCDRVGTALLAQDR